MQIFLFINGNDQYRIIRIQQTLCNLQTFLHERQPFTVAVFICTVHIIVIVFPVFCAGVIGRIDVDTIHFSRIQIFQKLQSMVVICFNQGVPKVTVWGIAHFVQHLETGIDWVTQFCRCHKVINRKFYRFIPISRQAESLPALNFQNSISFVRLSPAKRYL